MSIYQQCLYARLTFEKRSIDPCPSLYAVVGFNPFSLFTTESFLFYFNNIVYLVLVKPPPST